jgi:hypothetical protein
MDLRAGPKPPPAGAHVRSFGLSGGGRRKFWRRSSRDLAVTQPNRAPQQADCERLLAPKRRIGVLAETPDRSRWLAPAREILNF